MAGVRLSVAGGCPVPGRLTRLGPAPGDRPRGRPVPGRRTPPDVEQDLIAGLVSVCAALRAGSPTAEAWQRGLGLRVDGGVPGWLDLVDRCGGDRGLAAAVRAAAVLAAETGAPLVMVLERVAAGLAADLDAAGRRAAALAGPRATARLLAWLPVAGLGLGLALGADPVGVLLDGQVGTMLLLLGGLCTAAGMRWSSALVARAAACRED